MLAAPNLVWHFKYLSVSNSPDIWGGKMGRVHFYYRKFIYLVLVRRYFPFCVGSLSLSGQNNTVWYGTILLSLSVVIKIESRKIEDSRMRRPYFRLHRVRKKGGDGSRRPRAICTR